jgi:putative hydrolase
MLKIDLHIHTTHSGHAYATIYEIMRDAKSKGMQMIAITDHGPSMIGTTTLANFGIADRAPKTYEGVEVLWGCEANITDGKGSIDLDDFAIKKLDIILVGLHIGTPYKDLGKKKNTESVIKCFKKYPISIFTHPATLSYDYDAEKVFQAACDNDILLELNLTNLVNLDRGYKNITLENLKKMVNIAKKNKKKLIINSDTHFLAELGNDDILKKYWDKLGLNDTLIINNYPDELRRFIKSKNLPEYNPEINKRKK